MSASADSAKNLVRVLALLRVLSKRPEGVSLAELSCLCEYRVSSERLEEMGKKSEAVLALSRRIGHRYDVHNLEEGSRERASPAKTAPDLRNR